MKSLIIFFFITISFTSFTSAQEVDSTANVVDTLAQIQVSSTDSTQLAQTTSKKRKGWWIFKKYKYHSPKKALFLSLLIPGAGQAYNRRYWKMPIVYAALGGMIYLVDRNTKDYRYINNQYLKRVDGDPLTIDDFEEFGWSEDDINSLRNQIRKNKELSYIGLVAVHLFGAAEAFVDAHLMDFKIDDDLSMRFSPSMESTPITGSSLGVGVTVYLHQKTEPQPKVFFAR